MKLIDLYNEIKITQPKTYWYNPPTYRYRSIPNKYLSIQRNNILNPEYFNVLNDYGMKFNYRGTSFNGRFNGDFFYMTYMHPEEIDYLNYLNIPFKGKRYEGRNIKVIDKKYLNIITTPFNDFDKQTQWPEKWDGPVKTYINKKTDPH